MAGSLDDFLNLALTQKRAVEDAVAKREAAGHEASEKMLAARAKSEHQAQEQWDGIKAQIDAQVDAINAKSAALELVAEVEERFAVGAVLASLAIHFIRTTGFGKISLFIQVGRVGSIEYRLDQKSIFSGKLSQVKPKDHEAIMSKILAHVVASLAKSTPRPQQPVQGSRSQVWGTAKGN